MAAVGMRRAATLVALTLVSWWLLRLAPAAEKTIIIGPAQTSLVDTMRSLYFTPPEGTLFYSPPSPNPPPPPPAPPQPSTTPPASLRSRAPPAGDPYWSSRKHALHCGGLLLDETVCAAWYTSRLVHLRQSQRRGGRAKSCEANCHGHGVCDLQTGVCACEAGYNGSSCRSTNLRECNHVNDGLWHASHCAGECDERTGYCWCPGRIGERPMADTCQVKHMSVDAFAAFTLKPDPAWIRFAADGSKVDGGVLSLQQPMKTKIQNAFAKDLQQRSDLFRKNPAKRAAAVSRFWFGNSSNSRSSLSNVQVTISEYGVPHATRSGGTSSSAAAAAHATPSTSWKTNGGCGHNCQREQPSQQLAPAEMLREEDKAKHGSALYQKLAARGTWPHDSLLESPTSWCEASDPNGYVDHKCPCLYDGYHGELCEKRHEPFCLNQCSGHGICDPKGGGYCRCDDGYFGIDCSMTTGGEDGNQVQLHSKHAAVLSPRRPTIYVYELWDHTSLILQYRAYRAYCVHRLFNEQNQTEFNDNYAYTIETAMHEWMLNSPHRTLDGANADFYYVPSYLACTILPVFDWVGPGPYSMGYPMRPVTAMRMAYDALQQVRTRWPYFNTSIEERQKKRDEGIEAHALPNHIFLFPHDEGACWAPKVLYDNAIILTHWGRMDKEPHSSSRYVPDNWEHDWRIDERAPNGQRWSFPKNGGSRSMIGKHPCYDPLKDIVIPVFASHQKWMSSPWLWRGGKDREERRNARSLAVNAPRPNLAYFSGNLALNEPTKYARGIRHRLHKAFSTTKGWKLIGKAGGRYSLDLSQSDFCLVPPGGDGWSSRTDDAVRHGCIPVIIMDNVHMPFETSLNYSAFSIRIPERDVEQLDTILRSIDASTKRRMREAMRRLWVRFVYARSFLEAEAFLPARLPRDHVETNQAYVGLREKVGRGYPDAFDTMLLELVARRAAL